MSTELDRLIRSQIAGNGGWLPFDAFMATVLYAPGLGYYSSGRQTFGRDERDGSDFITAPEMSALFARCLARQIHQALVLTGTEQVYEFGAGTGALASGLLEELAALGARCARYNIIDLSGSLQVRQRERLGRHGERVQWLSALPDRLDGVVIGNEVLDAMPVKLLCFDGQDWLERGVVIGDSDNLCWRDRATPLRPPLDHGEWRAGTVTEIHLQGRDWMLTIGTRLGRGAVFLIDYGFGEAEYYHPQRLTGTLICHHRHRSDDQPLQQLGEKDITAHVNFTEMALAGQEAGLELLGYTSQGRFLLNCGIAEDLVQATLPERSMAQRLVNEHEMGELFKVIGFARSEQWFEAMGFGAGDRSHRL